MAAGAVTFTEIVCTSVKKIVAAWTSGTGAEAGTASGTTSNAYDGELLGMTTIPAGGGDAPDDNYDITLKDTAGHDVLLGAGTDRDTANTEHVAKASLAGVAGSKLTFAVAAAGEGNKGTAVFYIR